MKKLLCLSACMIALTACNDIASSGARKESAATKQLLDQAATVVGMPAIMNFAEKRQLKMLYELRDNADLATYSYFVDFGGNLHPVCPGPSVGYGMPFSAQFTAPYTQERVYDTAVVDRAQPEPNGLYMPDSTSATWVICLGADKTLKPVYGEPQIIVSLEPMLPERGGVPASSRLQSEAPEAK